MSTVEAHHPPAPDRAPRTPVVLGLLAILAGGGLLAWCNRGLTFVQDEWDFIQYRLPDSSLTSFLIPHNAHFVGSEVALYKGVFAVAGVGHYWPYQLTALVGHAVVVLLVFVFVRRRLGATIAFFAILPIVVLGSAWEALLLPINEALVYALAAFLGAVLLLDRQDRRADIAICLLLLAAVSSFEFGLAAALGVFVRLLWRRDEWRRIWTAIVPLAIYGLWYLDYGINAQHAPGYRITASPAYLLDTAAETVAGLLGLSLEYPGVADHGWLVVALKLVTLCLVGALIYALGSRRLRLTPTLAMLLTTLGLWWLGLTLTRGYLHVPYTSHYFYISIPLLVLIGAEVFRDRPIPRFAQHGVIAVSCVATVLNAALLVHFSHQRRHNAAIIAAEVGALQLARNPFLDANLKLDSDPAKAPSLRPAAYFSAIDKLHSSPAPSQAAIANEPEYARAAADKVLIRAFKIAPRPFTPALRRFLGVGEHGLPGVDVEQATDGTVARVGRCIGFVPRPGGRPFLTLTLRGAGAIVTSTVPVQARLRLFAHRFSAAPQATLTGTEFLPAPRARISRRWHLLLIAPGPVRIC